MNCDSHGENNLGNSVSFQLDGLGGDMRQAERSDVADSLDLMDDGIGVWKVDAVVHGQRSGLSHHPVNLGLNLFCASREDTECQHTRVALQRYTL